MLHLVAIIIQTFTSGDHVSRTMQIRMQPTLRFQAYLNGGGDSDPPRWQAMSPLGMKVTAGRLTY